eukprot:scaffold73817_cov57-Phaeocystis_antarctica.AAC.1
MVRVRARVRVRVRARARARAARCVDLGRQWHRRTEPTRLGLSQPAGAHAQQPTTACAASSALGSADRGGVHLVRVSVGLGLGLGPDTLGLGHWALGIGLWALGYGHWERGGVHGEIDAVVTHEGEEVVGLAPPQARIEPRPRVPHVAEHGAAVLAPLEARVAVEGQRHQKEARGARLTRDVRAGAQRADELGLDGRLWVGRGAVVEVRREIVDPHLASRREVGGYSRRAVLLVLRLLASFGLGFQPSCGDDLLVE